MELGIDPQFHEKNDIHIHIPEGAIPKDGPSAGITMATANICPTGRKVSREVAMTGEITLRGRVLPIGGLKEKSLAAHRAGITKILVPKDNERDLLDIPDSVRNDLEIILVAHMDEVLAQAFAASWKRRESRDINFMKITQAEFIISAVQPHQYPEDALPEIALAGRSNVGKSSLINKMILRKKFGSDKLSAR